MVAVLDLGLGERGLLHDRPHHRLLAAVQLAGQQELAELAIDPGLGLMRHGGVGMVPVPDHAEALELAALDVDPVLGELAALASELGDRHRILVLAGLAIALLDLPFDRQAVAVPAWDVDGVLAQHLLAAVDHVLQDLVEGGAHVQVAVGVRRPVVEDELRAPRRRVAQPTIDVETLPPLQELGFARRQIGAHRKRRLGQEYCGAIVSRHDRLSGLQRRP